MARKARWLVWASASLLLILSGLAYRLLASHLKLTYNTPVALPVPLRAFPTQISNWIGRDISIATTTREYVEKNFADDFISRRYTNSVTKAWADLYVVYCSSRPGGMLGHQPRVCYPAHGWVHDGTERTQFVTRTGQHIPCLIHRFHKLTSMHRQTVVLNFYILNGQVTTKESDFFGPIDRRPNIARNPARYLAQVQISSVLENPVRSAAKDMTDLILHFLPDRNGEVEATTYINATRELVN